MKITLIFAAILAVLALLITATPAQVVSFIGACGLLGAVSAHRRRSGC